MIDRNKPLPLYYQVYEVLENKILAGEWGKEETVPTEQQLCQAYRVSRTTVRQAVHRLVEKGLLYIVQGKGTFVADLSLKKMPRGTQSIGIAVYDIDYITKPYFSTIVSGICHQASFHDYHLQFISTNGGLRKNKQGIFFLDKTDKQEIEGVVIIDQIITDEEILKLKSKNFPFVLLDREIAGEKGIRSVIIDNTRAIFKTTEHFIKSGHKRIAFIVGLLCWEGPRRMLKGYRRALEKYGLPYDASLVKEHHDEEAYDVKQFQKLLSMKKRPTAFVAADDIIATQVLRVARNMGFQIPAEVAVIGFNDTVIARNFHPPLSSVKVPLRKIGKMATKMLFKIIAGGVPEQPNVVLKTKLVIRSSSEK